MKYINEYYASCPPSYMDELMHYGVLGMKWGQHKARSSERKLVRTAKKDAKEYARAKMFYGEGAGNRRKLINAKVNERSKNSAYKNAFEKNLAKQDMAKHATKAKKERKRKDVKNAVGKTTRGIYHSVMQDGAKVAAGVAAAYAVAHYTGMDRKVASYAKTAASNAFNKAKYYKTKYRANRVFRAMG